MKQLSIRTFDTYLANRIKDNFFIIYGQEAFFFDILIKKIEDVVLPDKKDRELNQQIFYGTENTISDVLSACLSFPMFSERKLVVVKEFDKLPITDTEAFLKYISNK